MSERYAVERCVMGARGRGDDRAAAFMGGSVAVLVLADGAGGGGRDGAGRAAERVVARVERAWPRLDDGGACAMLLAEVDQEIARDPRATETTGIVAVLVDGVVMGAGVGDSVAWRIGPTGCEELAGERRADPRLGSGVAVPRTFEGKMEGDTLLLASDGLWKYARREAIVEAVLEPRLDRAVQRLVEAASLPSGALCDDVGIVLARDGPLPPILHLERTYGVQMAAVRQRAHAFGRARGWEPVRRGRHAHASIGGPLPGSGGLRGVIDFEMVMEPWDWARAPSCLGPSTPFCVYAAVWRDGAAGREVEPQPLRETIDFGRLQREVGEWLERGWRHVTEPRHP